MATPEHNSVPVRSLSLSGQPLEIRALLDGTKWGSGGYGAGVVLTYSFPTGANHAADYGTSDPNEWDGWSALTAPERAAVTTVLADIAKGANVAFVLSPDNGSAVGELRFTASDSIFETYAHAYFPDSYPEAGDVWFGKGAYPYKWNGSGGAIAPGSYEYMTIVHETGHALGLKHTFEDGATLPPEYDNYLWTVMSYTAREGADWDVGANFYPTTLMYLDLLALEELYGPSQNANPGNTNYTFRENRIYWETISDSGGIDTITYLSSSHGGRIDLSNETFSHMGRPVRFDDGPTTRDTIGLGPSTRIENATGGDGDDRLIGNHLANRLIGNGGGDHLTGANGRDSLEGGSGADRLFGESGDDTLYWQAADTRLDGGAGIDLLKLSSASLNLGTAATNIVGIERIDMTGAGTRLVLNLAEVLAVSDTSDVLTVLGDAGDVVDLRSGFELGSTAGGFETWRLGAATVRIEVELEVV